MLRAALRQDSDTVFVDLLTYGDLEALKASRSGGADTPLSSTIPPNNKRYLILTYAAEFDRVHYPLPLAFDEAPDSEHLRCIIAKLREELDKVDFTPLSFLPPSERMALTDFLGTWTKEITVWSRVCLITKTACRAKMGAPLPTPTSP